MILSKPPNSIFKLVPLASFASSANPKRVMLTNSTGMYFYSVAASGLNYLGKISENIFNSKKIQLIYNENSYFILIIQIIY